MQLNPVSGNMYDDVDFTHNILRGRCRFDCTYCYMKSGWYIESEYDYPIGFHGAIVDSARMVLVTFVVRSCKTIDEAEFVMAKVKQIGERRVKI